MRTPRRSVGTVRPGVFAADAPLPDPWVPVSKSPRPLILGTIGPGVAELRARRACGASVTGQQLQAEWRAWDAEHGFAFRAQYGWLSPAERERWDAGERPAHVAPPPPGWDEVAEAAS